VLPVSQREIALSGFYSLLFLQKCGLNCIKTSVLLWILLNCQFSTIRAQQKITGIVVEEDERGVLKPLQGAAVYWLGTNENTTTNQNGVFYLSDLRSEKKLVVAFTGFWSDTLELKGRDSISIVLHLKNLLKTLEITGKQQSSYTSVLSAIKTEVLTEQELFKAACCNLSESFETNATVDVANTDAVTGARQIQMLGLSGIYTQISNENLPSIRGLSAPFGLMQLPGSWIESIQISKGIASVANGFEGITGQINVEIRKPFEKDQTLLNGYLNQMGRSEINAVHSIPVNQKWGTTFMAHGDYMKNEFDRNYDGFMDIPDGHQLNVLNRWMYRSGKNLSAQFGIRALDEARRSGTVGHNDATFEHAYLYQLFVRRAEAFGKLGYIFPNKRYKSIGLLGNYIVYDQKTTLGRRWYDARQFSGYASVIYQSIISNTNHKFRTGFNLQQDQINENFNENLTSSLYSRNEVVAGAFFEYTGEFGRSSLVAGLRGDYNNLFGWFATPRIHYKFQWTEKLAIRISGGRGQRTANVLAENISYLVSSRLVGLPSDQTSKKPYGLLPEIGWNTGGAINSEYELSGRTGFISADIYYTWFQRQTVVDLDASPKHLFFYNQNRNSSAASAQLDLSQEISNRFDVKLSYKYTGAFTTYQTSGRLQRPFLAPHRGLANIGYHSRKNSWLVDLTLNYIGKMRLPDSQTNPVGFRMLSDSPAYALLNIQITRNYKRWAVYVGMENIEKAIQERRIVSPEDPHSTYFDASYSWGPAFGRMLYGGLRYVISKK
jgi:hypothetical protein